MNEQPTQTYHLPQEGERVGSGTIRSLISAGGSARVYKTWVENLELNRAVKVMNPDAGEEIKSRFRTEARITSKLIHQNIVQVHNFGETASGLPYIEMELISGPTIEKVIQQRGAMPLPVALAIVIGVLDALNYAHNVNFTLYDKPHKGIMHRDIKPGNVILSGSTPKLMDFGIARPVTVSLHTMHGSAPGTVPYMTPEVCAGGTSDFRSDIYQVGLLLYECVTGAMAYPQQDVTSVVAAITAGEYKAPNTLPKAAAIIKQCLDLFPEKRYQSAQDCLSDVRALLTTLSPKTAPDELIIAFLDGSATAKPHRPKHTPRSTLKNVLFACSCTAVIVVLVFGLVYLIMPKTKSPATATSANSEPEPPPAATPEPTKAAPTPTTKTPAPPTSPTQAKRATAQAAPATPAPEDAMNYIEQGKKLLAENKPQEALAAYQVALKTPSSRPRQDVLRLSLYGTALCNSRLYELEKISRPTYETAWRNVKNAYAAGTPEHTEAMKHLEIVEN